MLLQPSTKLVPFSTEDFPFSPLPPAPILGSPLYKSKRAGEGFSIKQLPRIATRCPARESQPAVSPFVLLVVPTLRLLLWILLPRRSPSTTTRRLKTTVRVSRTPQAVSFLSSALPRWLPLLPRRLLLLRLPSNGATARTRCSLRILLPPVGCPLGGNRSTWRIRYRSRRRERVFAPYSTTASRITSQ
jgi:hypothetical protein